MSTTIKTRRSRTASGAKFSIIKYKGEVVKALTSLLVLKMDVSKLDEIIDTLCQHFGLTSVEEVELEGEELVGGAVHDEDSSGQ